MAVEEKHIHRIGLGIGKVDIAQEVKRLSGDLAGVRRETVRDFETVLIRLMFLVAAESAADRIGNKEENREQEKLGGQ